MKYRMPKKKDFCTKIPIKFINVELSCTERLISYRKYILQIQNLHNTDVRNFSIDLR